MGKEGERDGKGGEEEGGRKGEKGDGWRREGENVTEGMGGTGHGMGWDGEGRERRKGREREEKGYSPQTSTPGAATGLNLYAGRSFAVRTRWSGTAFLTISETRADAIRRSLQTFLFSQY